MSRFSRSLPHTFTKGRDTCLFRQIEKTKNNNKNIKQLFHSIPLPAFIFNKGALSSLYNVQIDQVESFRLHFFVPMSNSGGGGGGGKKKGRKNSWAALIELWRIIKDRTGQAGGWTGECQTIQS